VVRPGGTHKEIVVIPTAAEPGLHRIVKHVSSEEAGVRDAELAAELTVLGDEQQ
jgi:hypothetical protein